MMTREQILDQLIEHKISLFKEDTPIDELYRILECYMRDSYKGYNKESLESELEDELEEENDE
jgi:hypothetical protein